jgi:hypothetical protein
MCASVLLGGLLKRPVAALLLALITTAVSSPSEALPPLPELGKALLIGADVPWMRVRFVKLDDAPSPSQTMLSIQPGHHTLLVTCELTSGDATQVLWGVAVFDVKEGQTYDVVASTNHSGRYCDVGVVDSQSHRGQ